jgi:DNA-binding NarL/FixJ family response regulator
MLREEIVFIEDEVTQARNFYSHLKIKDNIPSVKYLKNGDNLKELFLEKGVKRSYLVDINLGRGRYDEGIMLIKIIRENDPDALIIVYSAYPDKEHKCLEVGADLFFQKDPVTYENDLWKIRNTILREQRNRQKNVNQEHMQNTHSKIFLCYSRDDKEKVCEVYDSLNDKGYKPWMDIKNMLPGEKWKYAIREAISDSHFFLVFLSSNSYDKRGFFRKEISMALDIAEEKLDSDIYIIPVRIEDCEVKEADALKEYNWLNLYEDGGINKLIESINEGEKRYKAQHNENLPLTIKKVTKSDAQ